MKENFSYITFVLDASGSMNPIKDDTIGGFNHFLEEQKRQPGTAHMALYQFSTTYSIVFDGPLQETESLSSEQYTPSGGTALLDCLGDAISRTGNILSRMEEAERPSNVVFVILTDGYENSSKEYTRQRVADMIQHQTDVYSWDFIFLGANMDSVSEAGQLNIDGYAVANFAATMDGVKEAYTYSSNLVSMSRKGNLTAEAVAQVEKPNVNS